MDTGFDSANPAVTPPPIDEKSALPAASVTGTLAYYYGVGFGLGLLKPAPGTWGSLLALPIAFVISELPWLLGFALWMTGFAFAWVSCGPACRALGKKDPGEFVADEFVALSGVYLVIPFALSTAIAGFALFRLFDIWKPWPVRWFDRRGGTAGVMLDDVAAAVYTLLILVAIFMA